MFWKRFLLVFVLWLAFFACENPENGLDSLFPGPGFEKGWSWIGMPTHYDSTNLYDYIDGEAELYLSYGFRELATVTYFWGSADDTSFVVDIYDMGTVLQAFGLYSSYRHPGYEYDDIGSEAIVSDYGIRFYDGKYVVDLKTGSSSGRVGKAVRTVAERIDKKIDAPADPPELLTFLPEEGRIEKTLRYLPRGMLSQAFLPGGLEARYGADGTEAVGFVILFDDAEGARQGFDQLRTFHENIGYELFLLDGLESEAFGAKTPYRGYLLVSLVGRFLAGVQDVSLPGQGESLLLQIIGGLPQG